MGLANKIMYDEVAPGTDPLAPENKVVFAVGPLTATGVPLAGRTTIASLSTYTKDHQVVDAHCGGMIGAAIKKAGWDAIVIEGASDEPVYLKIDDDNVEIKPADQVWGLGTRATTEALSRKEGTDFCVATIGPAGENLLPYACIINSRNHPRSARRSSCAAPSPSTWPTRKRWPTCPTTCCARSSVLTTTTSFPPPSRNGPSTSTREAAGPRRRD